MPDEDLDAAAEAAFNTITVTLTERIIPHKEFTLAAFATADQIYVSHTGPKNIPVSAFTKAEGSLEAFLSQRLRVDVRDVNVEIEVDAKEDRIYIKMSYKDLREFTTMMDLGEIGYDIVKEKFIDLDDFAKAT